jgi:hypothetical protein
VVPLFFFLILEKQFNGDCIMPIREHVDMDLDLFAEHALDRVAAGLDLRTDRLDDDARRRRLQFFAGLIQA